MTYKLNIQSRLSKLKSAFEKVDNSYKPLFEDSQIVLSIIKVDEYFQGNISTKFTDKIYPHFSDIFRAFSYANYHQLKVILIGQDPYYNADIAQGLCFSVRNNIKAPGSLKNIVAQLHKDMSISSPPLCCGFVPSSNHCLIPWAKKGVLLLNSVLTVEHNKPRSHFKIGWIQFTSRLIKLISDHRINLVFLLWGNDAQKFAKLIDPKKHLILQSSHPSSLSAYRGFFQSRHFSLTNQYLLDHGIDPIDWSL